MQTRTPLAAKAMLLCWSRPAMDRTLRVWDTDSGVTLRVLQGHTAGALKIAVHAAPGAGQGMQVFSASNDGTVRRWDIAPLPYQQLVDLPGSSSSAAIAPSGKYVAVGFDSGALRLYSLPEMRVVGEQENAHSDHSQTPKLQCRWHLASLGKFRQHRQALGGRS